jgi:excisionase family DNA binding protein
MSRISRNQQQAPYLLPNTREDALVRLFLRLSPRERVAKFTTTSHAAELVGVSRRTIQLWVELGWLDAVRVGRRYQVSVASLEGHVNRPSLRYVPLCSKRDCQGNFFASAPGW